MMSGWREIITQSYNLWEMMTQKNLISGISASSCRTISHPVTGSAECQANCTDILKKKSGIYIKTKSGNPLKLKMQLKTQELQIVCLFCASCIRLFPDWGSIAAQWTRKLKLPDNYADESGLYNVMIVSHNNTERLAGVWVRVCVCKPPGLLTIICEWQTWLFICFATCN